MLRFIHCLGLLLCLALLPLSAQPKRIGKTPQTRPDYAQGVSGHAAAMLQHGERSMLVMVGGCNFPEQPASEGGVKRYYAEVYATHYLEGKKIKDWQSIGTLPEPLAYAGYVRYDNSLILAGGKTTTGDLRRVQRLSFSAEGTLQIDSLPSLPEPRSGMGTALVGSRLYLVGGAVGGTLSTSVISLDLEHTEEGWRTEPPYPGAARLKVLATATKDRTGKPYLFAHTVFSQVGTDNPLAVDMGLYTFDPATSVWHTLSGVDYRLALDGNSFGGGHIYSDPEDGSITLVGGVHMDRFLPALQREQHMRMAQRFGDEDYLVRLRAEVKDYLLQPAEWYQFAPVLFMTTVNGSASLTLEPSRHYAKADGALVEIAPGRWILLGGEIKPGVRTADIIY